MPVPREVPRKEHPCIACYTPVKTYIVVEGTLRFLTAALVGIGVPYDDAIRTMEYLCEESGQEGPWWTQTVVVCTACAARAGLRPGPRDDGTEPLYRQPLEGSYPRRSR